MKVFDVVDGSAAGQGTTLRGHQGPVWQVAWAHPKFGPILASASYDGKVFIWKDSGNAQSQASAYGQGYGGQVSAGGWAKIKEHAAHSASGESMKQQAASPRSSHHQYTDHSTYNHHSPSVNSISWAPHELGSILACASSDGNVSVLAFNDDGSWGLDMVAAHPMGCNAVSWAPATVPGSLITAQQPPAQRQPNQAETDVSSPQNGTVRRFASAGCDNVVKIWEYSQDSKKWEQVEQLTGHTDWVRDVAFAPNIGLPRSYLATCSQDRTVLIWTQDGLNSPWTKTALNPEPGSEKFADTVWRVSWSISGNVLAVSCGDGKVTLWKENLKGAWECCSE